MIWLNGWAWLGILGVAFPVLIHLLGRGHARVHRFPTLRFIDPSRLLPTKRTRVHDPLLLAVRIAIVALAAGALAQPLLLTRGRRTALDRGLARAIIVDTSASMNRLTASGRRAVDSARSDAARLAREAQTSIVVESADPSRSIEGATAWLAHQQRRAELVVLSDFQVGAVEQSDFAVVPRVVGIRLLQIATRAADSAVVTTTAMAGRSIEARSVTTASGARVEWSQGAAVANRSGILLLSASADSERVAASLAASEMRSVPLPIDTARVVVIVFPGYPGSDSISRSLRPPRSPWALDLLARVRAASLAPSGSGESVVGGRTRLVLFTSAAPGTLAAAQVIGEVRRATSAAPTVDELTPDIVSDAELAAWQRPAAVVAPSQQQRPLDDNGPSDARWLWVIVLGMLLVEWRLRRMRTDSVAIPETPARAA